MINYVLNHHQLKHQQTKSGRGAGKPDGRHLPVHCRKMSRRSHKHPNPKPDGKHQRTILLLYNKQIPRQRHHKRKFDFPTRITDNRHRKNRQLPVSRTKETPDYHSQTPHRHRQRPYRTGQRKNHPQNFRRIQLRQTD